MPLLYGFFNASKKAGGDTLRLTENKWYNQIKQGGAYTGRKEENMDKTTLSFFLAEIIAIIAAMTPVWVNNHKIKKGQLCQLRSEMLRIYYGNREKKEIRQYEIENFNLLYEAYKSLGGNSFIDEIKDKVRSWDVIT